MKNALTITAVALTALLSVASAAPAAPISPVTFSAAAAAEKTSTERATVLTVKGAKRVLKLRISERVSPAYGVYYINSYAKAYVAKWNELCATNSSIEKLSEYKALPITSDDLNPSAADLQKEPFLGFWVEYAPAAALTDFQTAAAKAKQP